MHLQENTVFDLNPKVKVTSVVVQYCLHHAPATSNGLYRRCIHKKIHYLTFEMLSSTCYATAKFEAAVSYGLGGDAFTRKYII